MGEMGDAVAMDEDDQEQLDPQPGEDMQDTMTLAELCEVLRSINVEILFAGLKRFELVLRRLLDETVDRELSDEALLIKSYFKMSPECTEILGVWTYQLTHEVARLETVILDVVHHIIVCTKFLGGTRSIGTSVVRHVLRNHMKPLYRNLASRKYSLVKSTVQILKAMSTQGSSTTKELYETFNFSLKVMNDVLKMRKKGKNESDSSEPVNDQETVRDIYIQYLLGFVSYGDVDIKKAILESRGTLGAIFKGIKEDSVSTIHLIFSVSRRKILDDISIPKATKVTFFNGFVLDQITRLFSRTEPSKVRGEEFEVSAKDLAQSFLKDLCTKPGFGICFKDIGWLMDRLKAVQNQDSEEKRKPRQKNAHLIRWARSLRPSENETEMDILLEFLRNCPSLVPSYCDSLSLSFEPRLSEQWLTNMALIARIIKLPIPDLSSITHPQSFNSAVASESILPICLTRAVLSKGLQHRSHTVRNSTALVLSFSLTKLLDLRRRLKALEQQTLASDLSFDECIKALLDEVWKRVPDIQTVFSFRTTVSAPPPTSKSTGDGENDNEAEKENEEDFDVTEEVLKCSGLQLLRLYVALFPGNTLESRFDFSKLIPERLIDIPTKVRRQIVALIEEVPAFKWWAKTGNKPSHLHSLLSLIYQAPSIEEKAFVLKVSKSLLLRSNLFREFKEETEIWLATLWEFTRLSKEGDDDSTSKLMLLLFDDMLQASVKGYLKLFDKLSNIAETTSRSLSPFKTDIQCHIISCRQSKKKFSGLPFSVVVISALELLIGLHKRQDITLGQHHSLWRFYTIACRRILLATQGVSEFMLNTLAVYASDISEGSSDHSKFCQEYLSSLTAFCEDTKKSTKAKVLPEGTFDDPMKVLKAFSSKIETDRENSQALIVFCEYYFPVHGCLKHVIDTMPSGLLDQFSAEFLLSNCSFSTFQPLSDTIKKKIQSSSPAGCRKLAHIALFLLNQEEGVRNDLSYFFVDILSLLLDRIRGNEAGVGSSDLERLFFRHPILGAMFLEVADLDKANINLELLVIDLLKSSKGKSPKDEAACISKLVKVTKEAVGKKRVPKILSRLWEDLHELITVDVANTILQAILASDDTSLNEEFLSLASLLSVATYESNEKKLHWVDRELLVRISQSIENCSPKILDRLCGLIFGKLLLSPIIPTTNGEIYIASAFTHVFEDLSFLIPEKMLQFLIESGSTTSKLLLKRLCSRNQGICLASLEKIEDSTYDPVLLDIIAGSGGLVSQSNNMIRKRLQNSVMRAETLFLSSLSDGTPFRLSNRTLLFALQDEDGLKIKEFLMKARLILKKVSDPVISLDLISKHLAEILGAVKISHTASDCFALVFDAFIILLEAFAKLREASDDDSEPGFEACLLDICNQFEEHFRTNGVLMISEALASDSDALDRTRAFISSTLRSRLTQHCYLRMSHLGLKIVSALPVSLTRILPSELSQTLVENPALLTVISSSTTKKAVLSLLLDLIELDPKQCCRIPLLSVIVKALDGFDSEETNLILSILSVYERKAQISTATFILQWNAMKGVDGNLSSGASSVITPTLASKALDSLDSTKLEKLINDFPINQSMDNTRGMEDHTFRPDSYALQFLILFIVQSVSIAGESLDVSQFIESRCLGFTVMCLTSLDVRVRESGFFILDTVYPVLSQSENLKEGNQVMLVLSRLKNVIVDRSNTPPRIPTLTGLFIAESIRIMTKPESPIYPLVNGFLLARPIMDEHDVPMFYALFNSTTEHSRLERQWLLRLLAKGIKCEDDYQVYRRRFVFDLLFNFYHASHAEFPSKKNILELLGSLSVSQSVISDLSIKHGILPFLFSLLESIPREPLTAKALASFALSYYKSCASGAPSSSRDKILRSFVLVGLNTLQSIASYLQSPVRGFESAYYLAIMDILDLLSLANQFNHAVDANQINFSILNILLKLLPGGFKRNLSFPVIDSGTLEETEEKLRSDTAVRLFTLIASVPPPMSLYDSEDMEEPMAWLLPWMLDICLSFLPKDMDKALELFLTWLAGVQERCSGLLPMVMMKAEDSAMPGFCHRLLGILAGVGEISRSEKGVASSSDALIALAMRNYTLLTSDVLRICRKPPKAFENLLDNDVSVAVIDLIALIPASVDMVDSGSNSKRQEIIELAYLLFQTLWGFNFEVQGKEGLPPTIIKYIDACSGSLELPGSVQGLRGAPTLDGSPAKRRGALTGEAGRSPAKRLKK
ncbi:nucleolar pre-ribosomal-associated protein 1 [Dinochytrium kinnereticum]|nr:nucleolar pre-ribosomal-associated protein 1 [Dinochytrium kinnereticum]